MGVAAATVMNTKNVSFCLFFATAKKEDVINDHSDLLIAEKDDHFNYGSCGSHCLPRVCGNSWFLLSTTVDDSGQCT